MVDNGTETNTAFRKDASGPVAGAVTDRMQFASFAIMRAMQEPAWRSSRWIEGPTFAAYRNGRFIVAELAGTHRVLSTSSCVGGLSTAVRYLVNHQSCEGAGHTEQASRIMGLGLNSYHRSVCDELGLVSETAAVMGTAANMIYAAHETATFDKLRVDAIVTAGVEGNATCAGDPSRWVETSSGWDKLAHVAGMEFPGFSGDPVDAFCEPLRTAQD